ncbi:hypothetical protein [Streptomyces sp. AN091965]|uniref:hypothetical protein n=1 Tax=Streptomyces sp. AN091965 TaxID=2927803 RepID=UPI001F604640|nr:hypothetical protein [Streptomyces sp. AN091965]MCI3935210.1 hypothetical protein [Streptomyces sp. AN091965]
MCRGWSGSACSVSGTGLARAAALTFWPTAVDRFARAGPARQGPHRHRLTPRGIIRMTALPPHHRWILTTEEPEPTGELPEPPRPELEIGCHRRLRGPFTGGGSLLRHLVPELLARDPESVAARATEITVIAPDLAPLVPRTPQTLTQSAGAKERTRFHPAPRALRIAHGVAELALDRARLLRAEGAVIAFYDVDEADPTDRELVAILLRRCDPARLTVVAESHGDRDDALTTYTVRAARTPRPAGADLAQLFIDSDGTSRDPAVRNAYYALPSAERARRHTARADALRDVDYPTLRLGAVPYHLEHGCDPAGAGVAAFVEAVDSCFAAGLCCLGRGHEAFAYLEEMRRSTADPDVHMGTACLSAMLHTRFLPREDHDEDLALAWVNTAIALADSHPDPERRLLARAFMRKDHTASLRDYDDVIRHDPDHGDHYFDAPRSTGPSAATTRPCGTTPPRSG